MSDLEEDEISISLINKDVVSRTSVAWNYFGVKLINGKRCNDDIVVDKWYCALCFENDKILKGVSNIVVNTMFTFTSYYQTYSTNTFYFSIHSVQDLEI